LFESSQSAGPENDFSQYKARRLGESLTVKMLLRSVLVSLTALPALISGNQFPIVNGVIGGVPSPDAHHDCENLKGTFSNIAPTPTPGKLRVVENSGICGRVILFIAHPQSCSQSVETTPHVYQASGYGDLASDKSIWFAFHCQFAASLCNLFYWQVLVFCSTQ